MTKKVVVALSGGIDSAVAAKLLLEQGYEVVGLTGKMTCSEESGVIVKNAKKVADRLGIEHCVYDATKVFEEKIINYFETSYREGLTPNPCIMCNKFIKWGVLFDYAINTLKSDYIATGHYACINNIEGAYRLYPASDEHKDQLYFLFLLTQEQLGKTIFPLSNYQKSEVRALAEKYDLPSKSSKESQDICFINSPMTTKKYLNEKFQAKPGSFVEKISGKVLGKHNGAWQFTIGQRKGIGIAAPEPLYVVEIDSENNKVFVGTKDLLLSQSTIISNPHWAYKVDFDEAEVFVKIRYNMPPVLAKITCLGAVCNVAFTSPISGITPGQACVFYDKDDGHLLGGGFLDKNSI